MKTIRLALLAFACVLFGCQQAELAAPNDMGTVKMQTVTITAGIDVTDTKASLDSETGAFTWQSGDLISVLATDGNFYDFILEGEYGNKVAEFVGQIPEGSKVTTVATYPRIVANGSANTVLSSNTLNYVLPASWTWAKNVSNVPMVATFGEGAEDMSFKQVGGVMRFPVKNLPAEATFVVTMNDKTITGQFPVDITALGEACMVAGATASELVINYTSDVDGADAEFNVPVPTGVYNNFTVTVKDAAGDVLFSKDYSADNKVERATLLNMKEIVLPERAMTISEVWPFFVDARVVFGKYEGVSEYAFYIDGAAEPVIVAAEDLGEKAGALIGGQFDHKSTHTIAVAKVVDGKPVAASKSAVVEFTTGDVRQLTTNTGTKFVSVGWDDVSIADGPKYVDGKWTTVSSDNYPDVDAQGRKLHQKRGYQVQLLASDKTTVVYDMIPFDGHSIHQNAFYDSNTLGKIGGSNIVTPTAIAFGHLEPGKDYYFRVKTLDGVVNIDFEKGNYIAEGNVDKPYPYPLSSERGGCGWSDLIKLSTDPVHTPSDNEIFHEGFDDIMISFDYVNWAVGVVPDLETTKRQGWSDYVKGAKTAYPAFLQKPVAERKWTVHGFNQRPTVVDYGMLDNAFVANSDNVLNANAGSMQGWVLNTSKVERNIFPMFGAIAIGQAINNHGGSSIATPAINSNKLLTTMGTKCIVTMKVSHIVANKVPAAKKFLIGRYKNGTIIGEKSAVNVAQKCPDEWNANYTPFHTSADNYINHQYYYEIKHELYLKKGESIWIEKYTESQNALKEYGWLILGDIKVEIVPGEYDEQFEDNGLGTEPDDTDYDIYGLGEFPITYYHGAPTRAYTKTDELTGKTYYDYDLTKSVYQDVKDAGFNIVTYTGECDYSIEENKRILGICEELDLKFFSAYLGGHVFSMDWISKVKEHLYPSPAYIGDFLRDEPNAAEFDAMGTYVQEYLRQMPDKDVYVNLFPEYANKEQLGTPTYEEHIDQYLSKIPTKMIGFDYYGLEREATWLTKTYHHNYDLVRSKALDRRMPYMAITAAGGIGKDRKDPTEKELRWQVWSSIALGSKGISYFTYWTPDSDSNLSTNEYMITRDGSKRDMYYWVKQLNSDINTIGKQLLNCHADGAITSVTNIYPLYCNDGKGRTKYGPIKAVSGTVDYLCGCFRDARKSENGENYKGYKALVTHLLPARGDFSINLTLDQSIGEITFTHNNTTTTLTIDNTLNQSIGSDVTVSYTGGVLTLNMPEGEAVLLEF